MKIGPQTAQSLPTLLGLDDAIRGAPHDCLLENARSSPLGSLIPMVTDLIWYYLVSIEGKFDFGILGVEG